MSRIFASPTNRVKSRQIATIVASLLALMGVAHTQPVQQSGNVTPGHAVMWIAPGIVIDAGTAASGFLSSIGVTTQGPGICQNTAPITQAYSALCLGITPTQATLSVFSYNGASAVPLAFNINGVTYNFPYTVGGITGPGTTVSGDLVCWNNTSGTLVKDCGVPPVASTINVKAPPYNAKGDTVSYSDGTIAAGTSTLASASANCVSGDTGKYIILHGSGAAGVPQAGTITGCSGNSWTLSFATTLATPWSGTWSASVQTGGSGYTNGTQTLTVTGGTCITQPQFSVTVSGNAVTAVLASVTPGNCSVLPSNPVNTTGGGGTGAELNLVPYQVGGQFSYGTDDTTAVSNAVSAAISANVAVYAPSGTYWLASQSSAIALNHIKFYGDGPSSLNEFPFNGGTNFFISNTSTSVFGGMDGVEVSDMGFFWPAQDNSQTTPLTYPALFESSVFVNVWLNKLRIANAFQLIKVDSSAASSGLGRVVLGDNLIYCVDKCAWMLNGAADILNIASSNKFTVGAFGNQGNTGPKNLQTYTAANGEFIRIDVGSSTYTKFDGLQVRAGLIYGYRYGVRLLSGTLDVSNVSPALWDAIGTILSVEGAAVIDTTNFTSSEVYAINPLVPTQAATLFNFTSTATTTSAFSVEGLHFGYVQGSIYSDANAAVKNLNFTGNHIESLGNTTTSGSYGGILLSANSAAHHNIVGNKFNCGSSGNTIYGVLLSMTGAPNNNVVGNQFLSCTYPVLLQGTTGTVQIEGNTSIATIAVSLTDSSTATVRTANNLWDKPPNPAVTSCGTSPSIAATSDDWRGRVTVGTSPSTACTVTFISKTAVNPVCQVQDETTPANAIYSEPSSASAVVFHGTLTGGDVLAYQCSR